jgi:ADP-heptose:LPS heptosyltransferase
VNENILLIRLKSIGDVLFTRPAVHAVREAFPGAKISFLITRQNAPLLEGFRDVDEIIPLDRARYRKNNPLGIVAETFQLLRRLRAGRFSLVVDFQGYGETALLSWLSGAPRRWGNVYSTGRRWAYTRSVTRNNKLHPADWNLSLLQQCGLRSGTILNEFALPAEALEEAGRLFIALGLNPARRTLCIQPFTSTLHKNWPLRQYLAVAAHWHSEGIQVLFCGGPDQLSSLEPARQAGFPVSASSPLLISAGLMKLSSLVLGGDTGLLHLAVAMGKRVVMIMASDAPGHCHPFQHPDWAITPPKRRPYLISNIETGPVLEACARGFA